MAKPGRLQTFLEYSAAKSVLTGFGLLPAPAAMALGRGMGKLAYALAGDLRRTGATNLRLAFPEKTEEEPWRFLGQCFGKPGGLPGFFHPFSARDPEELKELIEVEGLENLEAA